MTESDARATLLLVEDDLPQRRTLAGFFRKRGYRVLEAGDAAQAETVAAAQAELDLLITDLRLGGPDGVSVLIALRAHHPELQAIVVTGYGAVEDAVRAMRAGAYDFVAKPVDLDRLEVLAEKALERGRVGLERRRLQETLLERGPFADLVGESEGLREAKRVALKVATSTAAVLILGESGTGKEVLARAIHLASARRDRAFVAVNCAAFPEGLVESELFGHERGAFTGAQSARKGRFELAHGGTLFLDEVGDIPLPVQVKLLRVLQSGRVERVGGSGELEVDVRIIAATHRDLPARIAEGAFREDLYYRLNVVPIVLPPLRDRPQDIPLLVEHFLRRHRPGGAERASVEPAVLEQLSRYPFPGNVRELQNWIERAVVLAEGSVLGAVDFPPQLQDAASGAGSARAGAALPGPAAPEEGAGLEDQVAALEVRLLREALLRHAGNKSAAARELGLTERGIRYKMVKYGL